jgi:hypothetical protein
MEDGSYLDDTPGKTLGIDRSAEATSYPELAETEPERGNRGSHHGEDHALHGTCVVSCIQHGGNTAFIWNNR